MLTKYETRNNMRRAKGSWYWSRPGRFAEKDKATRVAFVLEYRALRKALDQGNYTLEHNERGNVIWRDEDADFRATGRNWPGENRYYYDFGPLRDWRQIDTRGDASYFGVWVDLKGMKTFTYAEGDRTLVECPTRESFAAELEDIARFYGPPAPAFTTIDADGAVEHFYVAHPTLEDCNG